MLDEDGTFEPHLDDGVAPGRYETRYVAEDATTVLACDVEAGREDLELVLQ